MTASAQPTVKNDSSAPIHTPESLIDGTVDLVSLPDIYLRVRAVIDDPEAGVADLSAVVANDPSISARLLKLANSAFFGFTSRIDTVARATNLLGSQQIHDVVLATTVADAFAKVSPNTLTMQSFWNDAVHSALLARLLGEHCGIADAERFFVQGLLHNVGHLILDQSVPDACAAALEFAYAEHRPVWLTERETIGCDYAEVGALLMTQWNFPSNLIEAVHFHNEPDRAIHHPLDVAVVHAAVALLQAEHAGLSDALAMSTVDPDAVELLGLEAHDLEALRDAARDALSETLEALFPEIRTGA